VTVPSPELHPSAPLDSTEPVDAADQPQRQSASPPQSFNASNLADEDEIITPKPPPGPQRVEKGALQVYLSTFFTIFLAELGDKTQVTTLLMSAESQSPWIVFLGAGSALIATSLLGVVIGRWLSSRLSPRTIETAAGTLLLLIAVLLLWDVSHL
jgi:putative Ca2+/H+ antiporter (TMEM165/GDT1 family)